ncbi:hypothetical protein NVP1015O_12 [Vibrio phage 1.015.O._10N.222.51.E5]|nr:hypothetical protein NVP1015O_12 [Vibrio phage 1.015.O._10N.222.51.E5]
MKLDSCKEVRFALTEGDLKELKDVLEGGHVVTKAFESVFTKRISLIDKELSDVEKLCTITHNKDYIMSLLTARSVYQSILDLLK